MPYTINNPPEKIKALPQHAKVIWISVFNSALDQYKDEGMANAVAWSAVKNKYKKIGDKWIEKKSSEAIEQNMEEIIGEMKKNAEMLYPIRLEELKFSEDGKTTEIQVLPVGKWNHPAYGKIMIDEKDLSDFVLNFESNIRKELPITEGHSVGEEEKPAIGWFKQLLNKGRDGLWAVVEWTKEGMALLKEKSYKYFSPEFYSNYEDPESRKVYKNVLVGGALTNRPYFKGLQAVILSELIIAKDMKIEDILNKQPSELTDEEQKFLKENAESLTDEQKETFKDALAEGEEKKEEKEEEKKPEEKTEEKKEEEEKKEASEKVVVSKATLDFLEKRAQEGVKANERWREADAKGIAQALCFSESNSKGKFLPKSQDKLVSFLLSLSESQQNTFKELVAEMPQVNLFSEIGKASGLDLKSEDQIEKLVQEKMKADEKLGYRQALEMVFAENPELQKYSETR